MRCKDWCLVRYMSDGNVSGVIKSRLCLSESGSYDCINEYS